MKHNAQLNFVVWNCEKCSITTENPYKTPRIYHKTVFYGSFLKLSFSIKEKSFKYYAQKSTAILICFKNLLCSLE